MPKTQPVFDPPSKWTGAGSNQGPPKRTQSTPCCIPHLTFHKLRQRCSCFLHPKDDKTFRQWSLIGITVSRVKA